MDDRKKRLLIQKLEVQIIELKSMIRQAIIRNGAYKGNYDVGSMQGKLILLQDRLKKLKSGK